MCLPKADNVCALPPPSSAGGEGVLSVLYKAGSTSVVSGCSLTANTGCLVDATHDLAPVLYDCIESGSAKKGTCCPNKAAVCTMPLRNGGAAGTESRWWYNSIAGTCEQFQWTPGTTVGVSGNANNFLTMAQCLSYCQDSSLFLPSSARPLVLSEL